MNAANGQVIVDVDMTDVRDFDRFHECFSAVLGFPAFYGRNMNAWIDCMTSLDAPEDGLTSVHAPKNGVLTLRIAGARRLKAEAAEVYDALIECSAFVNWRRIDAGEAPVLVLAFRD